MDACLIFVSLISFLIRLADEIDLWWTVPFIICYGSSQPVTSDHPFTTPRLITYGPHDIPVIINGGNVLINGGENFTTQIIPQGVRKQEISRNREYLFIIYSWWSFWTIERTISVLKELSPRDRKLVVLIGLIKKWKENIVTIDIGRVSFDLITKCQALGYTIWVCSNRIARKVVLFGEYRPIYEPFFMQWQCISLA